MPGGMFIGTTEGPQPTPGFSETEDIKWVRAFSDSPYWAYMLEDTHVSSTFGDVQSGNNSWRWTVCTGSERWVVGADLNDETNGGNPDNPYVVLEVSQQSTTSTYSPWIFVDDIAIIIY